VLQASLYATCYTPKRVVYYGPFQSEYARFAESELFDTWNAQIDFTPQHNLLFMSRYTVELYNTLTGEHMSTVLNAANAGLGSTNFFPSCLRVGPDGLLYVGDYSTLRIGRYNMSDWSLHSASQPLTGVPFGISFANAFVPIDPADVFFYVLTRNQAFVSAYHYTIISMNAQGRTILSSGIQGAGVLQIVAVIYTPESTTMEIRSFEVLGNSTMYLVQSLVGSHGFDVLMHDLSDCRPTCRGTNMSLSCDVVDILYGTSGSMCDYQGQNLDDFCSSCAGCVCEGGAQPTCIVGIDGENTCLNTVRKMDPFGLRLDKVGRLYINQYTAFTTPLVVNTTSNFLMGQLGETIGYLATSMNLAIYPGPFAGFSKLRGVPQEVAAGEMLNFTVELRDSVNNTYQPGHARSPLEAVIATMSGKVLVGDSLLETTSDISSSLRMITLEHGVRVEGSFVPTTATLMYPHSNGTYVINPGLVELGMPLNPSEYAFSVDVGLTDFFTPIVGSGQPVFIVPGPIYALSTYITPAVVQVIAGEAHNLVIVARDKFKNNRYTGGQSEMFTWITPGDIGAELTIEDTGNGSYVARCYFTVSGTFAIPFLFDDSELQDSPVSVFVSPGAISSNQTEVSGSGLSDLTAENNFAIQPNDRFGNHVPYSPDQYSASTFTVAVYCPHAEGADDETPCSESVVTIEYQTDGSFAVTYRFPENFVSTQLKKVRVEVTYDGDPVAESPYVVRKSHIQEHETFSAGVVTFAYAVTALMLGCTLLCGGLVWRWRETPHIRFAQRPFLFLILIGCMFVQCGVLVRIQENQTTVTCCIGLSLTQVGFALCFGSMVAKVWRVMKIARGRNTLQPVIIRNSKLAIRVAVIVGVTVAWLTLWSAIDPVRPHDVYSNRIMRDNGVSMQKAVTVCESKRVFWHYACELALLAIIAYGMYLGYHTRKVHEAFAEGNWLNLAIYNFAVSQCTVDALNSLKSTPQYIHIYTVQILLPLIATSGVVALIFVPKFINVLNEERVSVSDFHRGRERASSRFMPRQSTGINLSVRNSSMEPIAEDRASLETAFDGVGPFVSTKSPLTVQHEPAMGNAAQPPEEQGGTQERGLDPLAVSPMVQKDGTAGVAPGRKRTIL